MVWKGSLASRTPAYSTVVKDLIIVAERPAVRVSEDGSVIAVLGINADLAVQLTVFSPASPKPVHVFSTGVSDPKMTAARHLAMTKDGGIVAFHA